MFKRKDLWLINFVVSFRPGMQEMALSDLGKVWTGMFPGYPLQFSYVSSLYKNVYRTERLQGTLLSVFTIIALFICSMGLLGLTLLTAQHRTKEIGLRKINGARVAEILIMLNRELVLMITISFVLAFPVSFIAMSEWLESYSYKSTLSWWIFGVAGLASLLISLLTVSVQTLKAATANPVTALRYE